MSDQPKPAENKEEEPEFVSQPITGQDPWPLPLVCTKCTDAVPSDVFSLSGDDAAVFRVLAQLSNHDHDHSETKAIKQTSYHIKCPWTTEHVMCGDQRLRRR